jgi:hypothetical protein
MNDQENNVVVPSINLGNTEDTVSNVKVPEVNINVKYATIEDFIVDLQPVDRLWVSKNKMLSIMPMTKGDRDEALRPINGQKIEAKSDGTTTGFYISLDLFDSIKQSIICSSLKHYVDKVGKRAITKEMLIKLDNKSYEELAQICLSVNKIDFFEANKSDVAAGAEAKN